MSVLTTHAQVLSRDISDKPLPAVKDATKPLSKWVETEHWNEEAPPLPVKNTKFIPRRQPGILSIPDKLTAKLPPRRVYSAPA